QASLDHAPQHPVPNCGQQLQEDTVSSDTGAVLQNGGDNILGPVGAGHAMADSFAGSLLKDSDATGKENESTFSVAHNAPLSKHLSSPVLPQPSTGNSVTPDNPAPLPSDQDPSPSLSGPV